MSAITCLSIVIPCRDEASNLPELLARLSDALRGIVPDFDVIIVDDGSTDGTDACVEKLSKIYPRIRYIKFSRSFGKEAALLAGLTEARGSLVAMMDGDLQHPPEVLAEMVGIQLESSADQVVGVRARTGEGPVRAWCSRAYANSLSSISDFPLPRGQGDFRVVTRRVADAVVSMAEVNRFNRGLFAWVGFPTVEVEFADDARTGGKSKWSPSQLVGYGLDGLLSFSPKPLRFLIAVGASSMGLFLAYVVIVVVRVVLFGVETPGYATLIAAVFFVAGIQAFSVGVLGEYLGRIFLEVKRRPPFIIMDRSPDLRPDK